MKGFTFSNQIASDKKEGFLPQPVITVHGIWTEGRWQQEIAPVLYPHFEPTSVKYGAYRFLGPLDLVFEPLVLLPGLAAWVAAFPFLWWREWLHLKTGASMGLLLVVVLIAAHLPVHIRLRRTTWRSQCWRTQYLHVRGKGARHLHCVRIRRELEGNCPSKIEA